MSSTIGRAQPSGIRRDLTFIRQRAQNIVDSAAERLSPLTLSILFAMPIIAAALFNVWIHVATIQLGYALSAEAQKHEKLVEENRVLRIDIAALRSPQRLKKLARESYNMGPPKAGQVLEMKGQKR